MYMYYLVCRRVLPYLASIVIAITRNVKLQALKLARIITIALDTPKRLSPDFELRDRNNDYPLSILTFTAEALIGRLVPMEVAKTKQDRDDDTDKEYHGAKRDE